MTRPEYQVENTAIGLQYVIPGTEHIEKPKRRVYRRDGDQLVLPGAVRLSTAESVARLAAKPITPPRQRMRLGGRGRVGGDGAVVVTVATAEQVGAREPHATQQRGAQE